MLLKDYYSNLNKQFTKFKFKGIAFDSAMVKNYIFCYKRNNIDGNKYIKHAIKNGSNIIISEKVNEKN